MSRGFSLIEALVATSLSLTLLLGALSMFQILRRSYLRTELAADAMQRARLGMESIAHDFRLAGLGVDPDGAGGRPDEPIEGAWAGAIAARADLDGDDPSERSDPERWIAGAFPSASTGNDEVFAYALRRESGSGGSDLVFEADVSSASTVTTSSGDLVAPRDGVVETVRLPRVIAGAGGSAGTGCTLYRASVANNASLWGTGNALVWQPLADAVSTLSFRYFDEAGREIPPPGGSEASTQERARIAEIEVRIVALEPRSDNEWRDPTDPDPTTANIRKAELVFTISLRNARAATQVDRAAAPAFPPP